MAYRTEDEVRSDAARILGIDVARDGVRSGVGQITTFNQLGFAGVNDKPDGWYLPENTGDVACIFEFKAEGVDIGSAACVAEIRKNCEIAMGRYGRVVGVLYNGREVLCYKNNEPVTVAGELQKVDYYLDLFRAQGIDKESIYSLTQRINNCLHSEFGIKNLYHRMIFTACALVVMRYEPDALSQKMNYTTFHTSILSVLNKELMRDKQQNLKLDVLSDVYSEIKMNLNVNTEDAKEQQRVKDLIGDFIGWVKAISVSLDSNEWNGEDVMGIFFNEFNRYKKKSESGQVFTPDHITNFMYHLIGCTADDKIFDGTCGSGAFLVKSMSNMIREAGGVNTNKARIIKQSQLFGIEYDREIFALACANMLIHKDGKTNLAQMDARTDLAGEWIADKPITKVLMNPPYENKYGCLEIVKNVLDHVGHGVDCAFILPDKKLEKGSKKLVKDILAHHRIIKIIKLPKDLFFGVGVETSIFVFEAGIAQGGSEIFTYYIEDDGLVVVKNKGRHDIKGRWPAIEAAALDDIRKLRGGDWIDPAEHLSYQVPAKPFEIFEEDFQKTALKYLLFKNGVGGVSELTDAVVEAILYGSEITETERSILIEILKEVDGNGGC